jgi:nucleoside-diphosphate-sugar epimerase
VHLPDGYNYSGNEFVNIGTGEDVTILEVAQMIREIVGFEGALGVRRDETGRDTAQTPWTFPASTGLDGKPRCRYVMD